MSARGTSNTNARGNVADRAARRAFLLVKHGDGTTCPCYRCGTVLDDSTLTVDRIKPGRDGGTYRRDNIRPACGGCNSETGGALARKVHHCVDCLALPEDQLPRSPRPAPHGGPRSRRCVTHWRAHRKATRGRRADARVVKVYGLEPGEYDELLAYQGGTCAIPRCNANGARKRLAVDHDHDTGAPRGLLCGPHNYELLGKYAGDLQAALDYLARPPAARLRADRLRRTG